MSSSVRSGSSYQNLLKALANLERSLSVPIQEPRDLSGILKDFEMTYELSWKVLKKFLKEEGHETTGAKDVFTKAYHLGFLSEQEGWIRMIQDRSQTSHVYEEKEAKRICDSVRTKYLTLFQSLVKTISS